MYFNWVINHLLAGSSMPGLMQNIEDDIAFLKKENIHLIITLTEYPVRPCLSSFGFQVIHFPISDIEFLTLESCKTICTQAIKSIKNRTPSLFHCKNGQSRTGLMLACTLISLGKSPEEALLIIEEVNPSYAQTYAQEEFIINYFNFLCRKQRSLTYYK